jgi:hypothetical protein
MLVRLHGNIEKLVDKADRSYDTGRRYAEQTSSKAHNLFGEVGLCLG